MNKNLSFHMDRYPHTVAVRRGKVFFGYLWTEKNGDRVDVTASYGDGGLHETLNVQSDAGHIMDTVSLLGRLEIA